jgi:hypothetical protein
MKDVIKIKKEIDSTTITIPELERFVGKYAEITISVDGEPNNRAQLRDRLMNGVAYLSGASFLDAEFRDRFDFK